MSNHPSAAEVAIAGHIGDVSLVVRGFSDSDERVRATALGSFHRLGALSIDRLIAGFDDSSPLVRRRAAELAHRGIGPDQPAPDADRLTIRDGLVRLLDDEASVAEVAAFSLGELGDPTVESELERVATDHDDALVRESAIAALGSLGVGLETILAAMHDKATVRRRAVIALSPFDDVRVDDALTTALEDRDWQVRQAAEDLVAIGGELTDDEPTDDEPADDEPADHEPVDDEPVDERD